MGKDGEFIDKDRDGVTRKSKVLDTCFLFRLTNA